MSGTAGVGEVTDATFADRVRGADVPLLVKFTASWCGSCRQLGPVLSAVAAEEEGRLEVVEIDVDSNPETAVAYGVLAMPTLMLFVGGEPVKSMVGARSKRRLLQELEDVRLEDVR